MQLLPVGFKHDVDLHVDAICPHSFVYLPGLRQTKSRLSEKSQIPAPPPSGEKEAGTCWNSLVVNRSLAELPSVGCQ
jgi:hypothetical protein